MKIVYENGLHVNFNKLRLGSASLMEKRLYRFWFSQCLNILEKIGKEKRVKGNLWVVYSAFLFCAVNPQCLAYCPEAFDDTDCWFMYSVVYFQYDCC